MRLLDLFCGAGGAAVGYHRAGFTDILGVDIKAQPNYPFEFVRRDALEALEEMEDAFPGQRLFDAIHASPPCQRWAEGFVKNRDTHPDLITPLRPFLERSGVVYVIENVTRAPLRNAVQICGGGLGLAVGDVQLHRHRRFESNLPLMGAPCASHGKGTVSVAGHGSPSGNRKTLGRNPSIAEKRAVMGIDWMTRDELSEAIPPAYTEFIGRQLLEQLAKATA